jgi:hypothetical protein
MSDRPPDFVPIRPNPFIVGNPVRDRSMFFGREAEFELVRNRFSESSHGGLLVFCGERRSGKTSILFQILDRRLGPDFIPVLIDMQSMAVANEIDFLDKLSREVLAALGPGAAGIAPPRFEEGSNHSATFLEFVRRVMQANPRKKLILLFDEYELFENKIDAGALAEDVLYILANLMEHQSVFLVFTGSQHLEERRAEYWKILGKSLYKTISYLDRRDALNLIQKPVEGRLRYDEGTVEAIYRLTAGQAFYTQAICQSLVDHLNEQRSNVATTEALAEVVNGLVNNPLPQMIFLWDGLERDEKLVLALLAESLPTGSVHATVNDLAREIDRRDYPLELSRAQISTALEKLFKSEMLLRDDATDPPGYAFRMDLWRLWIRRMHSVWQVMREEGLEIRRGGRRRPRQAALIGAAAALALAVVWMVWSQNRRPDLPPPPGSPPGSPSAADYRLAVAPENAVIYQDGRRIGIGLFQEAIAAGRDHRFRISAPGYADSELVVRLDAGQQANALVALRPLVGDLSITTTPPGAEVRIDGTLRGRSPLVVRGVPVARPARIEATLPGYGMAVSDVTPGADRTTPVRLELSVGRKDLVVTTDPPGAEVRIDRTPRGRSPARLGLAFGRHSVTATLPGYTAAETTVLVTERTDQIDLGLRREPPGILVVQGDRPAQIYLNGVLIAENVQNSGPRELPAGTHQVHVVLVSGQTIDQSVTIQPRERAVYDFSRNEVTRRTP